MGVLLQSFLTSELDGGELSASHPRRFTPRNSPWYGPFVFQYYILITNSLLFCNKRS